MKKVALAVVKDHFSEYLDEAAKEDVVITRHGRPAGVLVGFRTEDDWFDYRLENDPAFLKRIERARQSLRTGQGVPWPDIEPQAAGCEQVSDKPRRKPPTTHR
jgi:prevent-host-death family protein